MATAPKKEETGLAPRALKTFVWSAKKEDKNQTFLRGKRVKGLPAAVVKKYQESGLVEVPVVEKDDD